MVQTPRKSERTRQTPTNELQNEFQITEDDKVDGEIAKKLEVVGDSAEQKVNGSNGVLGVEEDQFEKHSQVSSAYDESEGEEGGQEGVVLIQNSGHAPHTPSYQTSHQAETSTNSDDMSLSATNQIPFLSPSVPAQRSQSPPRPSKIPKLNRTSSPVKKINAPANAILTPPTTTIASIHTAKGLAGVQKTGLGDAKAKGN